MNRPRIMFVDDEQRVLDGLRGSLWRSRNIWDMKFVCGGVAAIETLRTSRFDAVVTDMRMPDVDGEAVLCAAASTYPGALRVILSGQTDREVVARTTSVAHQFLSKPCPPDELRECIDRMLVIARPLDDRMRDLVCSVGRLPVSMGSLARLDELFCSRAVEAPAIVRCVEEDIGLTAKLLHVAGAGFFARRQSVTSVSAAIDILGIDAVRTFVHSIERRVHTEQSEWLFAHALACGQMMKRMIDHEQAFVVGVLHGLGKLAMLHRFGSAYAEVLSERIRDATLDLHDMERSRFGVAHDEVGAHLVELWGLAPSIGAAIRGHCAPPAEGDELALALHAACAFTGGLARLDARLVARFEAWRA